MKVGKRKTKKVNQIKKLESHWMKVGKRKTKGLSTHFRINVINHCNKKKSLLVQHVFKYLDVMFFMLIKSYEFAQAGKLNYKHENKRFLKRANAKSESKY